jgi:hypothetical protein
MLHRKLAPVALVCSFVLLTHSVVHAALPPPDDVALPLHATDVMVGFGDGYMGWDETLTRAQAVKIIITAMGYEDRARESLTIYPRFPDVDWNHWAFRFVNLACEFGIVKGYPDGTFQPEKHVTRAEYLVMLSRIYHALGGVGKSTTGSLSIEPQWMAEEVMRVPDLVSVLQPKEGESFDADISRAEAATLIYGLMDKLGLIYDFAGTVVEVKRDELVFEPVGSKERIVIGLSPDAKCVQGSQQVPINNDIAGKGARIILGRGGVCAFLRID